MAQNIKVPKFGALDGDENYTDVFDKVRNKRSGVKMNPKNSQHHSVHSDNVSSGEATSFQMETKLGAQRRERPVWTEHTRGTGREDGHLRKSSDSPQCHDTANPKVSCDSPLCHRGSINSSDSSKSGVKQNVGSDCRIEHSLLHPQHQAKVGGKCSKVSSHSWERKVSTEHGERKGSTERGNNLAPLTPGRCRLRSVTQDSETPDHGTAIPKFGDWDENDPKSADGFTHVFNMVREEKLNGPPNVATVKAFQNPYGKGLKQHDNEMSKKCCCFPW